MTKDELADAIRSQVCKTFQLRPIEVKIEWQPTYEGGWKPFVVMPSRIGTAYLDRAQFEHTLAQMLEDFREEIETCAKPSSTIELTDDDFARRMNLRRNAPRE